tara:strand:+ start:113 stop:412 length:300 start_codon:yes stop_codon:yes gene_type:complete
MSKGYTQLAGFSLVPPADTLQKAPTYIIINNSGSYGFSYPHRMNGQTTSSYISGSVIDQIATSDKHVNIKLDINPVKWKRLDGVSEKVGDVIFVYRKIG